MTGAREKWAEVRALDEPIYLPLGPNLVDRYIHDPKRVGFYMARYEAAAKFLRDCKSIADIGSGDSFASLTFLTDTKAALIHCVDFDAELVRYANEVLRPALDAARPNDSRRISFLCRDFLTDGLPTAVDGICSLDVLEHVMPEDAPSFVAQVYSWLAPHGIAVIGTPSANAAHLGSQHSLVGHVNNLTPDQLHDLLKTQFHTVLMAGFNDTVLHLGHSALWHYSLAICVK